MARSAADLALELSVAAGPDELTGGTAYKRPLPPPRHDRLADFRVLVIDKHPLCPTAESITTALNRLVDRLAKLEVRVVRENPRLPALAQTGRIYRELLAAFFTADLPPETLERATTAVKDLPADDQSLAAAQLRGLTISHADWIRKSRIRSGLWARWLALFEDIDVVLRAFAWRPQL